MSARERHDTRRLLRESSEMSYYAGCSVGLTVHNRSNWPENRDEEFMQKRYYARLFSQSHNRRTCADAGEKDKSPADRTVCVLVSSHVAVVSCGLSSFQFVPTLLDTLSHLLSSKKVHA